MFLHDEITRITDMDSISRVDLQGFALVDDFSQITREMVIVPVETAEVAVGSRLPTGSIPRAFFINVTGKDPDGKFVTLKIEGDTKAKLLEKIKGFDPAQANGITFSTIQEGD